MTEGDITYAAFWLYQVLPAYRQLGAERQQALQVEFAERVGQASDRLVLRGAYSLAGFRADADLMLWLHGTDLPGLHELAISLRRSGLGPYLREAYTYIGMVPESQYAPEHRPAFAKGAAPKTYLSIYPFIKTPAWYRLPFPERRLMMAEHGRLGKAHSALPEVRIDTGESGSDHGGVATLALVAEPATGGVLANTVHSFGLGDQEFVVAFEADEPAQIVHMVEELRAAEVRLYTAVDTPIFLGYRKSLTETLADL
jgi:peroxiredoxin